MQLENWGGQTVLMDAYHQWARRPDDERFASLDDLYAATLERANYSQPDLVSNDQMIVQARRFAEPDPHATDLPSLYGHTLDVGVLGRQMDVSHWSFGQMCSRAKVPAKWVRHNTHPTIAEQALNFGLLTQQAKDDMLVLSYQDEDMESPMMRAVTSPSYGRIYDHSVIERVQRVTENGGWQVPGASYAAQNPLRATTLYASDRDCFIFLVDPTRPIEVTTPDGRINTLFRGFMAWNSEVGHTSFGVMTFLYNVVCDNRIVWDVHDVKELRIRHTSGAPERFEREGARLLQKYAEASDQGAVASIEAAMKTRVGSNEEKVTAFLRRNKFTANESKNIIAKAREEEGSWSTAWDLVQGGTAVARGIKHQDARVQFERRVSGLLGRVQ